MKTTFKPFLILSVFLFVAPFTHAEFSITETVRQAAKSIIPISSEKATPTPKAVEKVVEKKVAPKIVVKDTKDSCEYFDDILMNTLDLESASIDARSKIEKIEETIETESAVRVSILDSIKNIVGLKQNDKQVFSEMKKDINEANDYYDVLDDKIIDTQVFLYENFCENTKLEKAEDVSVETENLVEEEMIFRKQFALDLKEKMKVLQDGVKNAKK